MMHSKDDDSIEFQQGVQIAGDLNAELKTYDDRGHFSEPENYKYILVVLKRELGLK